MLVFSLHEDPEEAGSNTGKGQMSLSLVSNSEGRTVSTFPVLSSGLPPGHPHSGGVFLFQTPHTPHRSAQQPVFQLVPETVKLTTKLRAITQARWPRNRSTALLDRIRKSGWNTRS